MARGTGLLSGAGWCVMGFALGCHLLQPVLAAGAASPQHVVITESRASHYPDRGGRLGVTLGNEFFYHYGDTHFRCNEVTGLDRYGSALAVGIQIGDRICSLNGFLFEDTGALIKFIGGFPPGELVQVNVLRAQDHYAALKPVLARLVPFKNLSVEFRTIKANPQDAKDPGDGDVGVRVGEGRALRYGQSQFYGYPITRFSEPVGAQYDLTADDLIYSVNGYYFADRASFDYYTRTLRQGTTAQVDFFRETDGKIYRASLPVTSHWEAASQAESWTSTAPPEVAAASAAPAATEGQQPKKGFWCTESVEQGMICLLAVGAIYALVSGIAHQSSGDSDSYSDSAPSGWRPQSNNRNTNPPPKPDPIEPIHPFYGDDHTPPPIDPFYGDRHGSD